MNFDPFITLNLIEANRVVDEISRELSELNRRKEEEAEEREIQSYQSINNANISFIKEFERFQELLFPHAIRGRSYFLENQIDFFDHTDNALEAYQYLQSAFKFSGVNRFILAYWVLFFPEIGESVNNNAAFPSLYTMLFCQKYLYNEVITTESLNKVDTHSMLQLQLKSIENANNFMEYIFQFESIESEGGHGHNLKISMKGPFDDLVKAGPIELQDGLRVEDPNIEHLVFSSNKAYWLIVWFLSSIRPFVPSTIDIDDINSLDTWVAAFTQKIDKFNAEIRHTNPAYHISTLFLNNNFNQHFSSMSPEKVVGSFVCKCYRKKFPELSDQGFYDLIEERSNAMPGSLEDNSARSSKLVESTINAALKSGLLKSGTKYLSDILKESKLSEDESKVEIICKGQLIGVIPVNE